MSVLVTGASGQLGRALCRAFADDTVVATTREDLDVSSEAAVADAIGSVRPDVVVNAAAMTDVDGCERDPRAAHRVNALGPWWLARACMRTGATLVTISTDHVFGAAPVLDADGAPRALTEFDPVAPVNAYGRSKAAGERLVRETLAAHHVVRTAWLTGTGSGHFVASILARARAGERLRVVDDQVGSPTFVDDLAPAIVEIARSGRHGTWHRTSRGSCTRYELACAVLEEAGIDVPVDPVTSDEYPTDAQRPGWSVLDGTHAELSGLRAMPHWRDALARFLAASGTRHGGAR